MSRTTSVDLGQAAPLVAGDGLIHLVADAYRTAVLEGANMRRATDALEAIRNSAPPAKYFDVWKAIDRQIGLADESALRRTLMGFRVRFADAVAVDELARLEGALAADEDKGWVAWLRCYANALDNWRWVLVTRLTEATLPFGSKAASDVENFRDWARLAAYDRWPEANELLLYLGSSDVLSNTLRASMYVYSAQVQLYHYFLPDRAVPLLEQAEELAADSPTVAIGWGQYDLQRGAIDGACERAEKVIAAHPDFVGAYGLLGQAFERKDELETAEHWYLEAQRIDPGDSSGHVNLLKLYGRPELIGMHESRFGSLLDRAIAVDPEGEYNAYVNMGIVYQQNGRYPEAHAWYDRAVSLDGRRDNAYSQKGYAYLDQSSYVEAEHAFGKVVEVAPGSFDGYWGLAGLYETQERWAVALEAFGESLKRRPEWRSTILARTGAILISVERYDEAERDLLEALRLDPGDEAATSGLERLAAVCYQVPSRTEAAFRILDQVHEIRGSDYDNTYWNLVGNTNYFFANYDEAIAAYGRAIEIQPNEPVFHANLSGAWEMRRQPGARSEELAHAIASARRASELAPGNTEYAATLSTLVGESTLVRVSGERALDLQWAPPLRVDVSMPLLPSVLDEQLNDVSADVLDQIEALRARIRSRTGILVPGIRFRELDAADAAYVIALRGTRIRIEYVQNDKRFCPPPLARLADVGIAAELHRQSLVGAWVDAADYERAAAAGIELWTPVQYMLAHLESILLSQLDQFVDHRQVTLLLEKSGAGFEISASPSLFREFVVALRALVREHVPLLELKAITEGFLALSSKGVNRVELVEGLRALPEVAASLPGNDPSVSLEPLDPGVEARLEQAVVNDGAQPVLALSQRDPDVDVRALQARPRHEKQLCLVVANPSLRPFVWALVESVPDVCVMSRDELAPERRAT
jgi:tetratricopeptide (TPR) repeat protein